MKKLILISFLFLAGCQYAAPALVLYNVSKGLLDYYHEEEQAKRIEGLGERVRKLERAKDE